MIMISPFDEWVSVQRHDVLFLVVEHQTDKDVTLHVAGEEEVLLDVRSPPIHCHPSSPSKLFTASACK